MDKFEIIYADPPWHYGQRQHAGPGSGDTGGAETHYPTVTLDRLKKLDVPALCADDCLLFMWATAPHLDQAIDLLKAWGFAWATVAFVWHKERSNPGFYTLSSCEFVLVGKRGKIPQPRGARNVAQFLSELRGPHSQKPERIREKIEAMFPSQRKLELFARRQPAGWSVFGNEVPDSIFIDWPE